MVFTRVRPSNAPAPRPVSSPKVSRTSTTPAMFIYDYPFLTHTNAARHRLALVYQLQLLEAYQFMWEADDDTICSDYMEDDEEAIRRAETEYEYRVFRDILLD